MKTKILIALLIIGIVFISGCVQESQTRIHSEGDVYKGVWIPTLLSDNPYKLDSDMKKLKELGVNTVFFQGAPPQVEHCFEGVPSDSELVKKMKKIIPIHKELMIANIQAAHRNGLKVGLTMSKCMPKSKEISLEAWNAKVIEYAKLAEEYDVELFAPMNEPEVLFGPSASATWGQEILPKIKEVYHGEVIWKGGAVGDIQPDLGQPNPTNFSGYDYLGFTTGLASNAGMTLEDFSQNIDHSLPVILALAERDNVKGVMITEFYGLLPGAWERNSWSEEKEARAHEIVLEKGRGKVVGFFVLDFFHLSFLGEDIPGLPGPEESSKTQEVIKKWFTEILK